MTYSCFYLNKTEGALGAADLILDAEVKLMGYYLVASVFPANQIHPPASKGVPCQKLQQ